MSSTMLKNICARLGIVCAALLLVAGSFPVSAYADSNMPRSLKSSNDNASATNVSYTLAFTPMSTSAVGSIVLLFCENSALIDDGCTAPVGFNATSVQLGTQLGSTGFALSSDSTINMIELTRPPTMVIGGTPLVYSFSNLINPSNRGPLYARVLTYASSDASGAYTEAGGLALYITKLVDINAEVPPYLTFCLGESITGLDCNTATEPFSDMGNFSATTTAAAQHQIVVATNAADGYSMWVVGSTMMSGGNIINAMNGTASQKGVSQFGINIRNNTSPVVGEDTVGPGAAAVTANYSQRNIFRFVNNDTLATSPVPDDYRKFTVSYIVNVPANQPGGIYSTTLTYVCLANF